ncbi:MAG TPA: sugar kinase [Hyphomicrobiaceae bacterium]|nr:sugar kinase [Hyphomicrobiaceae bacterium]
MPSSSATVLSIGECMVELARGADGRFSLAYGGDTFNTAVYLARAGISVGYATRLGDDPYSGGIIALAEAEAVDTRFVTRVAGRNAGLYLIETTPGGERSFHYWRERAPARELFDGDDATTLKEAMARAGIVYFSGITLSLYTDAGLDRFADALHHARSSGARIVMDGNFRPRGWDGGSTSGLERARAVFARFLRLSDIALPTLEDEHMLWGRAGASAVARRIADLGVREIALKMGADGGLLLVDGKETVVPCPAVVDAVDTTAAGDSFNAGYVAARLNGASPAEAALAGHRIAAVVIQHRGAVVPKSATDAVFGA